MDNTKPSSFDQVILGLLILKKYDESICAEHDIIYAGGGNVSKISTEDVEALEALGWHIESGVGYAKYV